MLICVILLSFEYLVSLNLLVLAVCLLLLMFCSRVSLKKIGVILLPACIAAFGLFVTGLYYARGGSTQTMDLSSLSAMPYSVRAALSQNLYTALQLAIRELAGEDNRALVFLGKIGVGLSADSLRRRTARPCDFLFLVLEENEEHSGKVLRVPESRGLSLRFIGGHDKAGENYKRLFDYMDERGLSPDGPALEITMIDQGFTSNASEFITEIQVPLKPY